MSRPSLPFVPDVLEKYLSIYCNPHLYHQRYDYFNCWSWTHWYNTAPLKRLLEELIDFDHINNECEKQLIVAATNVQTGKVKNFSNKPFPNGDKTHFTPDHILASGSIPWFYPMTKIGSEYYWDGAMYSNSPQSSIYAYENNHDVPILAIVVNLFKSFGHHPKHVFDVFDRITAMFFQNKFTFDIEERATLREYIDLIEQMEGTSESQVNGLPEYKRMKAVALTLPITIEPSEPEDLFDVFDYSERAIKRRIDAGYRDADRKLQQVESQAKRTGERAKGAFGNSYASRDRC